MTEDNYSAASVLLAEPIPDGEPMPLFVPRAIKADFRVSVREFSEVVDVDARLYPIFRPAVFSGAAVRAFYEAYSRIDRNTGAAGYAKGLDHLWRARNPEHLPLSARMAGAAQPVLDDALPSVTVTLPERTRQLEALFQATRTRDLQMARLCDGLRSGTLGARGYLASDLAMKLVPIPAARWNDGTMECAWREAALRPRRGSPAGTPYYRGLELVPATPIAPVEISPASAPKHGDGQKRMRAALQCLLDQGVHFKNAKTAHAAVLEQLQEDGSRRGYAMQTFYKIWGTGSEGPR